MLKKTALFLRDGLPKVGQYDKISLDYDNHASSTNCQSFLVHLAKADQLHLPQKVLEKIKILPWGINHMVINHWDVDSLLLLENPSLLPQIQEFALKNFARPPLENFTMGEEERLLERLKRHNVQFRGLHHDVSSHLFRRSSLTL